MEEGERGSDEGYLLVRIHVPELNVQKCLQFPRDQLVWDVKQQCLAALPKELKESFNYGLFSPPENGRAGKFLDEERRLGDYPFNGPVGYLELKYKRRVYKMISLDEKQLKSLHTRANLRRFLDYVQNGQVEKITKMCSKGLDPNFHCQESGETPLTIATGVKKPSKVLMALVNGGALLDYRTKDGSTAMHRSIEHKSLEAMKTLLELGASPNYKDGKGLTSLYLTITHNVDPQFTQTLLHDHATIGAQDLQGWQEVHQACKIGLLKHLEHLLFYGADMNARNASGNTPLHVCAVNNQESCAKQLLFRGADRQALNYANQTPCQVAVIAGNMELAEIIQNYRQEDVVPYRSPPSYNPKRRSAIGWLNRAPSLSTLILPPSPCPSDRSSAPFSSASSSLSDGSSAPFGHETDTASIVTVLALGVADKSLGDTSDIISDSSGVGTANSDTTNCSFSMPGTTVVCIEPYTSKDEGHISIRVGDIIEVTGATDDGYLEGNLRSGGLKSGLFPSHCVQEVRLRNHNIQMPMMVARDQQQQQQQQQLQQNRPTTIINNNTNRVIGRRESTSKHFATAPRTKKNYSGMLGEPHTVVLHRGRKGFGFILRGAKATSPLMELTPSEKCPALQYLDDVDPGGVADRAGLKKGDFLLEINREDVSSSSHEHVVDLIRKSGDLVQMTVVSLGPQPTMLPMSKSTILTSHNTNNINNNEMMSRQYATLPRKLNGAKVPAPLPPRRDPKTTLSVGRARAKSMVVGLEVVEKEENDDITKSSSAESISQTNNQPRTASIRQRPISSRITSIELEELFQRQRNGGSDEKVNLMTTSRFQEITSHPNSPAKSRVYASVAEMKRSKSKNKVRFATLFSKSELRRDFHSTPDLQQEIANLSQNNNNSNSNNCHSQEDLVILTNRNLPPPNHPPPPPPPLVQVVTVDVSHGQSDFDGNDKEVFQESVISSFRPTASAKLYASPEDIKTVGYRSKTLPSSVKNIRKSHSMRTTTVLNNNNSNINNITTHNNNNNNNIKNNNSNNNNNNNNNNNSNKNANPYAQPIRASRSHSTAGTRERRRKSITKSTSGTNNVVIVQGGGTAAPPIPEPDYSCSESESDNEVKDPHTLVSRLASVQLQPVENSGNSNTSGSSSSGSNSIPHSFSVEEIQKGRSLLKSSKSYPDDFLKKQDGEVVAIIEDGDNSSSGVSSDQENPVSAGNEYQIEHNCMTLPSTKNSARQQISLSRHAVSLAQLPPPIENENDEKEEFCLPPPPEFINNNSNHNNNNNNSNNNGVANDGTEAVLAPPPQFSDNRQVTRVRIVGAVPKPPITNTTNASTAPIQKNISRLHSQ